MINSFAKWGSAQITNLGAAPAVSVLMAVYNGEKYLQAAVDSILSQSYRDFEFIVVDDGSSDTSVQILRSYQDPRLVVLQNESNSGLAASLNHGLAHCRGALVARMDGDDIAQPERLSRQAAFMLAHPEVGVLGTQMTFMNADGKPAAPYNVPLSHPAILWRLLFGNPMAHPSIIFRRSLVQEAGGYNPAIKASQDKELWVRLIQKTRFANLSDRLMLYRQHGDSVWGQRADLAHANSLAAGCRLAASFLGEEVEPSLWTKVDQALTGQSLLALADRQDVARLITRLYDAVRAEVPMETHEAAEVHDDLVNRLFAVGRSDGAVPTHQLARTYWRSVLPDPIWQLGRALMRPKGLIKSRAVMPRLMPRPKPKPEPTSEPEPVGRSLAEQHEITWEKPPGLSIVVLSYERMGALKQLLHGLLSQQLDGIPIELILINNSPRIRLRPAPWTAVGRFLSRFEQVKILNSEYNWGPGIRYPVATAGQYKTILLIDDDIYPTDPGFIAKMYRAYQSLTPADILTCWADLWVDWSEESLSTVSMGFYSPDITRLTEVDYAGTGISMLDKRLLMHPEMLDIPPQYKFADTAWFPWLPTLHFGSRKFYFPSHGMLAFHQERRRGALNLREGYEEFIMKARRFMLERGYQPVKSRCGGEWQAGSPEAIAVQRLSVVTRSW